MGTTSSRRSTASTSAASPWRSSASVTLAPTATTSATPSRRCTATSPLPAPRWSATCPPTGTPSTTKSVVDGQFLGLPLDEDSEDDLTEGRYTAWVEQIKGEGVN